MKSGHIRVGLFLLASVLTDYCRGGEPVLGDLESLALVQATSFQVQTSDGFSTCHLRIDRVFYGSVREGESFLIAVGDAPNHGELLAGPPLQVGDRGIFPISKLDGTLWYAGSTLLPTARNSDVEGYQDALETAEAVADLMRRAPGDRLEQLKVMALSAKAPTSEWAMREIGDLLRLERLESPDDLKHWLVAVADRDSLPTAAAVVLDEMLSIIKGADWSTAPKRTDFLARIARSHLTKTGFAKLCGHLGQLSNKDSAVFMSDEAMLGLLEKTVFVEHEGEEINRADLAFDAVSIARPIERFLQLLLRGASEERRPMAFRLRMVQTIGRAQNLNAEQLRLITQKAAEERTLEVKRALMKVVAEHSPSSPAT